MTLLKRLGNKTDLSKKIIPYFPPHDIYIEPFFGAGGMFFNKPKAQYNILNDFDSDVSNLFTVILNQEKDFKKIIQEMPFHSGLLDYWKVNKETDPVKKAIRFLFLSTYSFMGTGNSLRMDASQNTNKIIMEEICVTQKFLKHSTFTNWDFRKFIPSIHLSSMGGINRCFIYADPPYVNQGGNYSEVFVEKDSIDLFNCLEVRGCKWAMSEFDNPFILKQAKNRKLNIIEIGERKNIKNRRTEILITNYKNNLKPMF